MGELRKFLEASDESGSVPAIASAETVGCEVLSGAVEIDDDEIAILIDQEVLGVKVAMGDAVEVEVVGQLHQFGDEVVVVSGVLAEELGELEAALPLGEQAGGVGQEGA